MINSLKKRFESLGIELVGAIGLKDCRIVKEYKLKKYFTDLSGLTAIMIAVPYLVSCESRNLSAYATSRDYHIFFKDLFNRLIPYLEANHPEYRFCGFADDSPIDERDAAASAGLGIIGDNGMLITEKYSSYVFLGEIITDMPIATEAPYPIKRCEGCGKCRKSCPISDIGVCLSALTQKKGELNASEAAAIKEHGSAWGCDICQEVCPHTAKAIKSGSIYTKVEFFKKNTIPRLTLDILDKMTDGEFSERAYSWRGRPTIRRNLELLESNENKIKE